MSRVLLVGRGPPERGGISAYMLGLREGPLARSHDIELLNLTRAEVPQAGRLTGSNIKRTLADTRAVFSAAPRSDVVHIHTALVPAVTLVRAALLTAAARIRRRPVILHVHSGKVQLWLNGVARRALTRVALALATRVVAVSKGAHAALSEVVGGPRVVMIENGVDVARFGPPRARRDPPTILYVGLLTPRKGLTDLVEASRLLDERGIDHEVVAAGGTPDEGPAAEAEVRRVGAERIRFIGPRPHEDMPDVYRNADVFCLPSWWEAMPLTVLEAMATGLPIVASAVGDIPRLIEDGVTGRLVAARDPTALADALTGVLGDPEAARRMGERARRSAAERFGAARNFEGVDLLYGELDRNA